MALVSFLSDRYNLHQFSDAIGLVVFGILNVIQIFPKIKSLFPLVRPYSHNKQSVPMNGLCVS